MVADLDDVESPTVLGNWTDEDVCKFHGFASIKNLMKLPGFPKPIPYPLLGRFHPHAPRGLIANRPGAAARSESRDLTRTTRPYCDWKECSHPRQNAGGAPFSGSSSSGGGTASPWPGPGDERSDEQGA